MNCLDERYAFPPAVASFVLAGSAVLAAGTPYSLQTGPTGHLAWIDLAVWSVLSAGAWLLYPQLWRKRQNLATKVRLLSVVCMVQIAIDLSAALAIVPAGGPGWLLPLREVVGAAAFCTAIWLADRVGYMRRPQETPSPMFERER